ncbi:universal stress protein [Halostagnicola bangensis]
MYQNVLIPTDGSDGTRRAIDHGLTIADRFDGTVHALSIVPEGPLGTTSNGAAASEAERAVNHVESEASRDEIPVTTTIERGVPHECVLDYASENDIDMIVMGTQGRTGLDRFLVGSVTERIVRMADAPVVTLRMTDDIEVDEPEEATRIARQSLESDRSEQATLLEEPHRTSGLWIVPLEMPDGVVDVHVDATTGDVRRTSTR